MGAQGETKKTNADFLRYCLKRVWMAEGASEEHGDAVANALMTGIRQGKLNQGLGVATAVDGHTHDRRTGQCQHLGLVGRGRDVGGLRGTHALQCDRPSVADRERADSDGPGGISLRHGSYRRRAFWPVTARGKVIGG